MAAGVVGLILGFFFLASGGGADIMAGAASFVAGSVLIAAGIVTLAFLSLGTK